MNFSPIPLLLLYASIVKIDATISIKHRKVLDEFEVCEYDVDDFIPYGSDPMADNAISYLNQALGVDETTSDNYLAWCLLNGCGPFNYGARNWCIDGGSDACSSQCIDNECDEFGFPYCGPDFNVCGYVVEDFIPYGSDPMADYAISYLNQALGVDETTTDNNYAWCLLNGCGAFNGEAEYWCNYGGSDACSSQCIDHECDEFGVPDCSCEDAGLPVVFNGYELSCTTLSSLGNCNVDLVRTHCPKTCGWCSVYRCEDSQAPIAENIYCSDLGSFLSNDEIDEYCQLAPLALTCRDTCNICD